MSNREIRCSLITDLLILETSHQASNNPNIIINIFTFIFIRLLYLKKHCRVFRN
jgi:hypothetical protein